MCSAYSCRIAWLAEIAGPDSKPAMMKSDQPAPEEFFWQTLFPWLLALLSTLPYWWIYADMDDEALASLGGLRLLRGEWPYRDFSTRSTPGIYFLAAPFLAIFGAGPTGTRLLMGCIHATSAALVLRLARRLLPGHWPFIPWVFWTLTAFHDYQILNYHWAAILFTLLTLDFGVEWIDQGSRRGAISASLAGVSAFWMLQSNGVTTLLMALFWSLRFRPRHFKLAVGVYLGAQLLLWLPFLPYHSQVSHELFSLGHHVTFNRQPYSWQPILDFLKSAAEVSFLAAPLRALSIWSYGLDMALYYFSFYAVLLLAPIWAERRKNRTLQVVAYGGLAWALTTGYCQTYNYLSYAAPVYLLILCAWLHAAGGWPRKALLAFSIFECLAWTVRTADRYASFQYPVQTRVGTYFSFDRNEALAANQLNAWIQENCPAGTTVFAYPYCHRIYTNEELKPAVPYFFVLPWLSDESEFQNSLGRLAQQQVQYVIARPLTPEGISSQYPSVPQDEYRSINDRWSAELFKNYEKIVDLSSWQVWRRKP